MEKDSNRIGLALSGGGYRAAAYHLGTLKKLNELEVLNRVDVISSISGGSITSAAYGLHTGDFDTFEKEFKDKLKKGVVYRVLFSPRLIVQLILVVVLIISTLVLPFISPYGVYSIYFLILVLTVFLFFQFKFLPVGRAIEDGYDRIFFKKKTLKDLRKEHVFAIGSTNADTGRPFTFSRDKMGDSKYEYDKKIKFKTDGFPVSRAVTASSCVPFAFTPVKIHRKFFENETDCKLVVPRLIDGGVYDNQGVHKLTHKSSSYYCDKVIVSNAGNEIPFKDSYRNTISLLLRTVDIFMNRIRNLQMMDHLFDKDGPTQEIGYISLGWDLKSSMKEFIKSVKKGHLLQSVLDAHSITKELIDSEKWEEIESMVSKKVGLDELLSQVNEESDKVARSVSTNLTRLRDKKINALMNHASVMTELHVKLYTPSIL